MNTLLFHTCCAPCLIAPFKMLKNKFQIVPFWYNDNLYPLMEYQKRYGCFIDFIQQNKLDFFEIDSSDDLINPSGSKPERCYECYKRRLKKTVQTARDNRFEYFSTTLLYSKYQYHETLIEICNELSDLYEVKFYYEDFRKLWQEGIKLSKEVGMYRQKYCGCGIND